MTHSLTNLKWQRETIPKTEAEFKSHSVYVLEKYLKTFECVIPSRVNAYVGFFHGQRIYRREHVAQLHSASYWRRRGRLVRNQCAAIRQAKLSSGLRNAIINRNSNSSSSNNCQAVDYNLYGEWQTDVIQVPEVASDGTIPVNEYGNIELWDGNLSLLPKGTSLVRVADAAEAAASLGIDFCSAIFGFEERYGGNSVPIRGGIVVLSHLQCVVEDAAAMITTKKTYALKEKTENRIFVKWRKITNSLLIRAQLRDRYGA